MTIMQPRNFLMIPGPTPIPDVVLEALARHPIGHRTADFSKVLMECVEGLKWLGETSNDVFVLASTGTGAMEAGIANTVNAGDEVLSLVCGIFSERLAKISEAYGAKVERLKFEPGSCIDPEALRKRLAEDKNKSIKVVTLIHNETSTGVINDVEKLVAIINEHGALSILDAVTSFGVTRLPIDAWKVDVVVTGSQKALMLPPGLAFIFFSRKAWQVSEACKTPRFYFALSQYKKSLDDNTTPFTPNVTLVTGLQASLRLMKEEGSAAIFARHSRLKAVLRAGLLGMGLKLVIDEDHASPSITSIYPPDGITVDAIRKGMREHFRIFIADGQHNLKGKIFRIGHMGYVFERDVLMTLAALEAVLTDLGYDCRKGAAVGNAVALMAGSH